MGTALASLALAVGCGGGTECVEVAADSAGAIVTPLVVHTGTNGRDTFRAVISSNFGEVEWTAADEDLVQVQRIGCVQNDELTLPTALLTAKAPGTTTVTGVSGDFSVEVEVLIADYTPEQYDLGQERYNANPGAPDDSRACADCHFGLNSVPHTPDEIAKFTDDDLILLTVAGVEPDTCVAAGVECSCRPDGTDPGTACAACPEADCELTLGRELALGSFDPDGVHGDHAWELSADEEAGIVAFMRGIAPVGF